MLASFAGINADDDVSSSRGERLSTEESAATTSRRETPRSLGARLGIIGPGLVLAATTVGIGDFISNAVAGERYGTTFMWAIVLAVVLKYFLTEGDRKSTRLNSSHANISYAVFCLKKKNQSTNYLVYSTVIAKHLTS